MGRRKTRYLEVGHVFFEGRKAIRSFRLAVATDMRVQNPIKRPLRCSGIHVNSSGPPVYPSEAAPSARGRHPQ
jgi:hypothetical protein